MNHSPTQTTETIQASIAFSNWLADKLRDTHTTEEQLANAIGLNRKAIVSFVTLARSPKLDHIVKIFNYFGYTSVYIPFKVKE